MTQIFNETRIAEADLSSKVGYGVKRGTAAKSMVLGTAGACIGVLIETDVANGQAGTVMRKGICEFAVTDGSGTAIAVGDPLTTNASGKFIKAATAGHMVIARAEGASSADGTQITIELLDAYPLPA